MIVPASEVLTLIQCTLCMVGNASEHISGMRCAKILESIDKTWVKFAEEEVEPEEGALIGEKFQTTLMSDVEDNTIAKALSITKRRDIIKAANWSSQSTFCRFYDRPISSERFGLQVLQAQSQSQKW